MHYEDNFSSRSVLESIAEMSNCRVLVTSGLYYSSYEMYLEQSNAFLLACVAPNDHSLSNENVAVFTTVRNAQCLNSPSMTVKSIVATMSSDWLSGLTFTVKTASASSQSSTNIAAIIRYNQNVLDILSLCPLSDSMLPSSKTRPSRFV